MKMLLLITTCVCLLCACVREEKTVINEVPLEISIASNSRGAVLPDGSELGVYVAEDSPENLPEYMYEGTSYKNIRAVVENGKVVLDENIFLSSTPANIYVYYPYKAFYSDMEIVRVTTKASPDFLMGKVEGINNLNPDANIVLQHMYSTIRFKIKNASGKSNTSILNIVLRNNEGYTNLSSTGLIDFKNCLLFPTLPSTHAISISFTPAYKITDYFPDDENSINMIVIPTQVQSGEISVFVSLSINDKRSFSIPATNWESGKIYTYNLSITN